MPRNAIEWFKENADQFTGKLLYSEPLSKHTYYQIGGPAELLAIPKSKADLEWLFKGILATSIPFVRIGNGSNLLASDEGFSGLVIQMKQLNLQIEPIFGPDQTAPKEALCGASVAVSTLLRRASSEGWGGLELLTGIPGTIGGVAFMNAGTHLGEARDRLIEVRVLQADPTVGMKEIAFSGAELKYSYRSNFFIQPNMVIWSVKFRIDLEPPEAVKRKIDETLARRKETQPLDYPSCGSVFKNPKGIGMKAWQVIDNLDLRGRIIGNAMFSEKHSNFIINLGNATAQDVKTLIELAQKRARQELGIDLETEVIFL